MARPFCALLTDMDGTLIHSEEPICRAIQIAFEEVGKKRPPTDALLRMFGLPVEQMLVALSDTSADDSACIDAFIRAYKRQYPICMAEATCIDGVKETLRAVQARGIPICLITSERRSNATYILDRLGLLPYLAHMVTRDEVTQCKPHPKPILAAAEAAGTPIGQCLYIGESPFDMQAGLAAGVYTVGVASGHWGVETLIACKPNEIVAQFSDILSLF